MRTTATNRKVRQLLTALREESLQPRPEFQRRLVWTNKDKVGFLDTVLSGYPFPEIYVAAGEVDLQSGEGKEMLVDGQQRVTTLYQYFCADPALRLLGKLKPYADLSAPEQENFLQYEVVVRDLGRLSINEIREVFRRINATKYSLTAMEIHNARYEGEFKLFGESIADHPFFNENRVFSSAEIKRMQDTLFSLILTATVLSTYFNRDDDVESFLSQYNDDFPLAGDTRRELDDVFRFVDQCGFPATSRMWKKADLFTLLVEVHRAIVKKGLQLDPTIVGRDLSVFYDAVNAFDPAKDASLVLGRYYQAALQASNDRSSRIIRGKIVESLISNAAGVPLSIDLD